MEKKRKKSRAEQNCNPGNIRQSKDRYKGEVVPSSDPQFKQFQDMDYGFRAIWATLRTYRYRHRLTTIRGIISRWAPPQDHNPTEAYIAHVCQRAGKGADEALQLTYQDMGKVVLAMAEYESGYARPEWKTACRMGYMML